MRSGEEIRQALVTFAKRWRDFGPVDDPGGGRVGGGLARGRLHHR
jgi:hypothetical protein